MEKKDKPCGEDFPCEICTVKKYCEILKGGKYE